MEYTQSEIIEVANSRLGSCLLVGYFKNEKYWEESKMRNMENGGSAYDGGLLIQKTFPNKFKEIVTEIRRVNNMKDVCSKYFITEDNKND